jgi:hypothetical protein
LGNGRTSSAFSPPDVRIESKGEGLLSFRLRDDRLPAGKI